MPEPAAPIIKTTAKQPKPTPQPTRFTIDFILTVLSKSLFNPFLAWILVLCLRAHVTPQSDPAWIATVSYACVLTVVFIARGINERVAHGTPRTVDDREVVLVTGGASGLGLLIAQIYAMRGTRVAVLDIKEIDEDVSEVFGDDVLYIACDVGDRGALEGAKEKISETVCLFTSIFGRGVRGVLDDYVLVLIACFN